MKTLKENTGGIVMCLFEILVGILLLINPVSFTSGIIIGLGVILLALGVVGIFAYFRLDPVEASRRQTLTKGLIIMMAGLFCIFQTHWFIATFPLLTILYGVIILLTGIAKIQWSIDMLRMKRPNWYLAAIASALSILLAIIILLNPFSSTIFLWRFVAITLILGSILDILALIFSRKI